MRHRPVNEASGISGLPGDAASWLGGPGFPSEAWDKLVHFETHLKAIERFFNRIKQFRRIATRYDKLAASFLSFIHLACAFVWLA